MTVNLENKKQSELTKVKKKLEEGGLDLNCSEEEKLLHLWHLLATTEVELSSCVENTEKLKQQQEEEMKEVENYVEHIRSLSDEREALTAEFEHENEILKAEINRLSSGDEGQRNAEVCEMLLQQGLEEVAQGTISEQIAYLLVERARLLDELEAEQTRNYVDTPDGPMTAEQLLQVLEQERSDFEEECGQQKESMKAVKEQMRQMHEEEVNTLVTENQQLQELLDSSNEKINNLDKVISSMQENLEGQMQSALKTLQAENESKHREKGESGGEEAEKLRATVRSMEDDNRTLIENIQTLSAELESEKTQHENTISLKERTTRRLQIEIDQQKQTIEGVENTNKDLLAEKESLTVKVETLESELKEHRSEKDKLVSVNKSLEDSDSEVVGRLKETVSELRRQKSRLEEEVEGATRELKTVREERDKVKQEVLKHQEEAKNLRRQFDKKESDYRSKVKSLESRVQEFEEERTSRDKQHQQAEKDLKKTHSSKEEVDVLRCNNLSSKDQHKEVISGLRMEVEIEQGKVRQEQKRRQHMEASFSEHRMHNAQNVLGLESSTAQLTSKMEEFETKVKDLTEERDELTKELEERAVECRKLEKKAKEWEEQVEWLEKTSNLLAEENTQLNQKVKDGDSHKDEEVEQMKATQTVSQQERNRLREVNRQNSDLISELEDSLQELKAENSELRVKVSERDEAVRRLQEELKQGHKLQATQEGRVAELESELSSVHRSKDAEIAGANIKVEQLKTDNTRLQGQLNQSQLELGKLKAELESAESRQSNQDNLIKNRQQQELQQEINRLREQLSQTQNDLKSSKTTITNLEGANERLQSEIQRKTSECGDLERRLNNRQADQSTMLIQAQGRAEEAEHRASTLQEELSRALSRLETSEERVHEAATLRHEVTLKETEITSLRSQLQDHQLLKTVASHSSDEVRLQLGGFREREVELQRKNADLQHTLLDVESKLDSMKERTRALTEMREVAEEGKKSLSGHVISLERQVEKLKADLYNATQQYESQVSRYNERKLRTKSKLQRAREMYNTDKMKLKSELEHVQHDLGLSKAALQREEEWRERMEGTNQRLVREKRDLMTQMTEHEEVERDQKRSLSMQQVRGKYLEEENKSLQQRVDSLSLQKHNLERILREYQAERQREEQHNKLTPELAAMLSPRFSTMVANRLHDNDAQNANHIAVGGFNLNGNNSNNDTLLDSASELELDEEAPAKK